MNDVYLAARKRLRLALQSNYSGLVK